jgi:hypothetical protein
VMTRMALGGDDRVKVPLPVLMVPFAEPAMLMDAPSMGRPLSESTVPLTGRAGPCASTGKCGRKSRARAISSRVVLEKCI